MVVVDVATEARHNGLVTALPNRGTNVGQPAASVSGLLGHRLDMTARLQ